MIVLGAGATRGAGFVKAAEKSGSAIPPVDRDFFTQAQRLTGTENRRLVKKLLANTVGIFGPNFDLTLERFLTLVEHLDLASRNYKLRGRPSHNNYTEIRALVTQVLATLLDETVGRLDRCQYHQSLASCLTAEDTILSFNYDLLMDLTLRGQRPEIWNPRFSYHIPAYVSGDTRGGFDTWAERNTPTPLPDTNHSVRLLKMHGSLNWFKQSEKENDKLKLRARWWRQHGDMSIEIVPPEWNKRVHSGIYKRIWSKARASLKDTKILVFIGYSLPPTDLPARALFTVDSLFERNENMLSDLVVVNPDQQSRERIRQTLVKRIDNNTRVLSYNTFEQFAGVIQRS